MLHPERIPSFPPRVADWPEVRAPEPGPPPGTPWQRLRLASSVIANTLAGACFLGALLAAPLWLDRLLALL